MKTNRQKQSLQKNQSGIASMVVVILIMTLLTLIVLAMTKNANREQQQALDRQLSSQAFYAAESGYNDAKDYVVSPPAGEPVPIEKDNCNGIGSANGTGNQFPGKNAQVGDFENTKYTCVLYNRAPEELRYFPVDVKTSTIAPIEDAGGATIKDITFKWNQAGGGSTFSGCPAPDVSLPKSISNDCEAGLIRVELVDPTSTNRQQLIDSTFLAYIKPSLSGSTTYSYGNASGNVNKQGAMISGKCVEPDPADGEPDELRCSMTINSINKDKLYLNLRSLYKMNDVTVNGHKLGGGAIRFRNAQMVVDSNGQAGDTQKRVQVSLDLSGINSEFVPAYVLQTSSDLCKRLEIKKDHSITDECS